MRELSRRGGRERLPVARSAAADALVRFDRGGVRFERLRQVPGDSARSAQDEFAVDEGELAAVPMDLPDDGSCVHAASASSSASRNPQAGAIATRSFGLKAGSTRTHLTSDRGI